VISAESTSRLSHGRTLDVISVDAAGVADAAAVVKA
jgi:hypothetical protein